jgi:hypothetical protein
MKNPMNRRIVNPLLFTVLMLCFVLLAALPAKGVGKSHGAFNPPMQETEEVDPCAVQHQVPGTVLSAQFLLDTPDKSGIPLIKLLQTDIIEVLGKNSTGFWIAARSNTGIIGWVDSTQVQVDKKLWSNPKIVPILDELPEDEGVSDDSDDADSDDADAEATDEAGDDSGDDAAADDGDDPFADCFTLEALMTADRFALQAKPLTRSGDVGITLTRNAKITILALNPSGSWAYVRAESGEEGWITTSYTLPIGANGKARLARLRKDYTVVEATLTPAP